MPKLFEVFGYPLNDESDAAQTSRRLAYCPFMDCPCDGGGNRYLSHIALAGKPELAAFFRDKSVVPSGVCSIQLKEGEQPWIVCPRRLLALGRGGTQAAGNQPVAKKLLFDQLRYNAGVSIGVWPEVNLKWSGSVNGIEKRFDYTFDYLLMPIKRTLADEVEQRIGAPWEKIRRVLTSGGYTLGLYETTEYVEEFPYGSPTIVEIMTCSTSGGNKSKRTTIPLSFEDAILGKAHRAPGINYRQVWARMVSQLIVKSEVALDWDGKAFWILQDVLLRYINATTGLDILSYLNDVAAEVNILSLTYGEHFEDSQGPIGLKDFGLFSGPISERASGGFQNMVRAPIVPPLDALISLLLRHGSPTAVLHHNLLE